MRSAARATGSRDTVPACATTLETALADPSELLAALDEYRRGRQLLLNAMGCADSNRDPFAEFGERLVAALLDGELASSRVQKGWDLIAADGDRVQVRYLANPANMWVNEHLVEFRG